ncbi:SDR family NAD(P)-dependent oxidoreductase [Aquabacter spiritensis]|uniref:3-hydroxybutyrate dehydrogenase n=1 Tax=Aquabacter spiritensis TaxID=933073 RepID=A0A4R3LUL1_9HYPH|nr:SDR family NAD(P)-dependent oxidoreductase [Aquabacter spiritensis]TCT04233.1 3-hydroxybutyrate dehydrogenase [Aquabacter spiritensis]
MSIAERTALVTGATGGLGLAIAERLVAQGCKVVISGIAPEDEVAETIARLSAGPGLAVYHRADLRDVAAIEAMMAQAQARLGPIDILVNNAVVRHFSPVEAFPAARWDEALAVNISAPFHLIRLAVPGMRAKNWGRIVNLGSVHSFFGAPNRVDYITSKTAIIGMTRAIALELSGTDITCNALCPGTLPTPAIQIRIDAIAAKKGVSDAEATREYLADRQPGGRFISYDAVTSLLLYLCSPEARDVNGAALPVDAAWTAS